MQDEFSSGFGCDLKSLIEFKVSLGSAESTYLPRARAFDRYCSENCPITCELTKPLVLAWLYSDGLKDMKGLQYKASFIRTFGEYLKANGKDVYIVPDDFGSGRRQFIPYIFSDEELKNLFYQIDHSRKPRDPFVRMLLKTYFRLTYTCGLRPREGRELKRSDIDLALGEIRIMYTKWGKSRTVVMSDDMAELARTYTAMRDAKYPDSEYLFPAPSGSPYTAGRMQGWFTMMFAASKPDVPKDLLPSVRVYDLRHRFATAVMNRWLDQGVDLHSRLPYLQTYMGHKDLNATMYYIHLLPENLIKSSGIDWESLSYIYPMEELWEK